MYLEFFHGGGVRTPQSKSEEKASSDSLSGSYSAVPFPFDPFAANPSNEIDDGQQRQRRQERE